MSFLNVYKAMRDVPDPTTTLADVVEELHSVIPLQAQHDKMESELRQVMILHHIGVLIMAGVATSPRWMDSGLGFGVWGLERSASSVSPIVASHCPSFHSLTLFDLVHLSLSTHLCTSPFLCILHPHLPTYLPTHLFFPLLSFLSLPSSLSPPPSFSISRNPGLTLGRNPQYEEEFSKLKNQDVTIRRLEERIEELQDQSEDIIAAALEKERARLEEMQSKHAVDYDRKNRRVQPLPCVGRIGKDVRE